MDWKDQENKIKAKLEKRRIQPKEELWSQLDKQLGVKESETSNSWKWAVAAVVLFGLLVGGIWKNQPVNEEVKISNTTPSFDKSTENKKESSSFFDDTIETKSVVQKENPDKQSLLQESSGRAILKEPKEESRAAVAYSENEKEEEKSEESRNSGKIISDEVDQRLVASENTEDSLQSNAVATDEVEVLLREALYKEFLAEIDSETDSTNIVAYGEKLLKEVNLDLEREEDRAFRDKIRDAIHKGWNKAKSAVAINPGNQ